MRMLLDILCIHCDDSLAENAFEAIMQHASAAAKPGDEFGIFFMKNFISDLADTPINQEWLAEIIGLLQQNLDSLCDRARGQIRSLGKLPSPERAKLKPPMGSDAEQSCDDGALKRSSEKIGAKPIGKSTNDRKDEEHQDNTVMRMRSRLSERKAKYTRRGSQPAFSVVSLTRRRV